MGDNGNVYQMVNNRPGYSGRTQAFTYDVLNRISSGQSTGAYWGENFTIDAWGNLTQETGISGKTYSEGLNVSVGTNNRFTTASGVTYDAAGNLSSQQSGPNYRYDAENRLVYTSAGGYNYYYDGDGNRVAKSNGTTGTAYWRGPTGDPIFESSLTGTNQEEYIFFNGSRVARMDVGSNAAHYYFSDHLGSSAVVETANGSSCEQDIDYYPYGGVMSDFCPNIAQHYRFTGKERDTESGLDNFGKRYHASTMGRFMTPDPIMIMKQKLTDPQQWNMYSYSRNNPLRFMDPTGMYATDCGSLGAKDCANRVKQIDAFQAKLAGSKNAQDQAIAKTLGTSKDTKNGVTIGFVKDFKNAEGKTLADKTGNTSGLFAAGQSTPEGRPVADIRIDLKGSLSGNDLSATVEHEGSHATDRMDFVNSCSATGCSQSFNMTGRQSEQNAYGAEYRFWQSVGQGQQHPMISSPDQINQFLNQHPDVYPRNTIDNLLFPSDL